MKNIFKLTILGLTLFLVGCNQVSSSNIPEKESLYQTNIEVQENNLDLIQNNVPSIPTKDYNSSYPKETVVYSQLRINYNANKKDDYNYKQYTPQSQNKKFSSSSENQNFEVKNKATSTTDLKENSASKSSIIDANGDGYCNDVKGNQGDKGWFYHVPGGASYKQADAEDFFCTPEQAEDAGYKAASK